MKLENLTSEQLSIGYLKMTELGFGSEFNNLFIGNNTLFEIKNVPTVFEFMDINPEFLSKNKYLICYKPGLDFLFNDGKMYQNSRHWKKFKKFLLDNGFNYVFWKPLFQGKFRNSTVENLSVEYIGIDKFFALSIHQVTKMTKVGKPYYFLLHLVEEVNLSQFNHRNFSHTLKVGDVVNINEIFIFSVIQKQKNKRMAINTLISLQTQFESHGLSKKHTKFMSIKFL
ncbi:MAG: hypothetical protein QG583_458 [Patescibacteria group bacterium]|nr:hypothetical protein [Patescibacteria group bacterium]